MRDPRFSIESTTYSQVSDTLRHAADLTRAHILTCKQRGFSVEEKPDGSLVTPVDKECEEKVRSLVAERFPSHGFLGEEYGHTKPDAAFQWVIDPIDGTSDFTRGMSQYGTVLGLFLHERPVAGLLDFPDLDLRFWAVYRQGLIQEGRTIAPSSVRPKPIISVPPLYAARRLSVGEAFLRATHELFPDYRSFWTCLTDGLGASGALDCSIQLNVKIWDVASAEILACEGGKAFTWLLAPSPWHSGRCSTALGDPQIVEQLKTIWKESEKRSA